MRVPRDDEPMGPDSFGGTDEESHYAAQTRVRPSQSTGGENPRTMRDQVVPAPARGASQDQGEGQAHPAPPHSDEGGHFCAKCPPSATYAKCPHGLRPYPEGGTMREAWERSTRDAAIDALRSRLAVLADEAERLRADLCTVSADLIAERDRLRAALAEAEAKNRLCAVSPAVARDFIAAASASLGADLADQTLDDVLRTMRAWMLPHLFPRFTGLIREMRRAREIHPGNAHLLAALTEEVGEVARAFLEGDHEHAKKEAIQVACVAMRIAIEGDGDFEPGPVVQEKP